MFTETELELVKSTIKLQGIANKMARKFGTCSREYVSRVLKSKTPPNTKMSIAIINEIRSLLDVLMNEES